MGNETHNAFTELRSFAGGGNAQAIIDAAIASVKPEALLPEDLHSIVVPAGAQHVLLDLEKHLPGPHRTKGTYTISTVESFIAFAKEHATQATTLWVDEDARRITALFNDATRENPAWRDHRAVLALSLTPEWAHWAGKDGRWMDQEAFAEHIEDGLVEIRKPAAADMLEIAQSFHATTNASFRSATRLSNGQVQVQYDEEVNASAGRKGELEIPEKIELAIPPFVGTEPYAIDARFRYRIGGGDIKLAYKLDHPERVLHDAIGLIVEQLRGEFDQVYAGAPAQ